jgi:hypothetical protein
MMNSIEPSLFPATPGNVKVIHGFQRDDAVLSLQQSSIKVQASLERPAYMSMSPFGTGRCTLEAFFPLILIMVAKQLPLLSVKPKPAYRSHFAMGKHRFLLPYAKYHMKFFQELMLYNSMLSFLPKLTLVTIFNGSTYAKHTNNTIYEQLGA